MEFLFDGEIAVMLGKITVRGHLIIPEGAKGIVLFAHGSGSSRFSPRNQFVAKVLHKKNLATFLVDLLTEEEERVDDVTREFRFDIGLLAERLVKVCDFLHKDKRTSGLLIGYFGASTGAAAALIAAAKRKGIFAVVSRGGRPDLAEAFLPQVTSPTLLIVGGSDIGVIELNQKAYDLLVCKKKLEIVPGATHLFEEAGALEEVARLAGEWFSNLLREKID